MGDSCKYNCTCLVATKQHSVGTATQAIHVSLIAQPLWLAGRLNSLILNIPTPPPCMYILWQRGESGMGPWVVGAVSVLWLAFLFLSLKSRA